MISAGRALLVWFVAASLAAAPARAMTPLEALIGEWSGRGSTRERPDKPLERVVCRLNADQSAEGAQVEVRGRCGGVRGSARFAIAVTRKASGGLAGVFTASVLEEALAYDGRETVRSLVFNTAVPIDVDGRPYHSRIDITFSSVDQFRMHETMTEAATGRAQTIFDMTYSRIRGN